MTAWQLEELQDTILTAAIVGAVAAWPAHRLESLADVVGKTDNTAVVIARVTKLIRGEVQRELNGGK